MGTSTSQAYLLLITATSTRVQTFSQCEQLPQITLHHNQIGPGLVWASGSINLYECGWTKADNWTNI